MDKCVIDLLSAVSQIAPSHFMALGTRANQTQYEQYIEQSFSAELFHQYRSIMDWPANKLYYQNLLLHFDITKASVNARPDLVLHESQGNRNDQRMFIEVKTDPYADLSDDFRKLIIATDPYLDFKNAVM